METSAADEIRELYERLIAAWNGRSADAMAEQFTDEGEIIGFDGSVASGRGDIFAHLQPIFANHPTAPFVTKVKEVRLLGADTALLRAIAGMVPIGASDIKPEVNAHQTLVAVMRDETWRIALFQNTPAQFHGRPELVEQMTDELRQLLPGR